MLDYTDKVCPPVEDKDRENLAIMLESIDEHLGCMYKNEMYRRAKIAYSMIPFVRREYRCYDLSYPLTAEEKNVIDEIPVDNSIYESGMAGIPYEMMEKVFAKRKFKKKQNVR